MFILGIISSPMTVSAAKEEPEIAPKIPQQTDHCKATLDAAEQQIDEVYQVFSYSPSFYKSARYDK